MSFDRTEGPSRRLAGMPASARSGVGNLARGKRSDSMTQGHSEVKRKTPSWRGRVRAARKPGVFYDLATNIGDPIGQTLTVLRASRRGGTNTRRIAECQPEHLHSTRFAPTEACYLGWQESYWHGSSRPKVRINRECTMNVGILGSGDVANALAAGLLKRGRSVVMRTRDQGRLAD